MKLKNKVYFHTLGCSKNDVDTSVMESLLDSGKYVLEQDPYVADVIVVNTCGFIDAAKEESIDAILNFAKLKEDKLKKLILAGCLAQRYAKELLLEIPEADGVVGTGNLKDINQVLDSAFMNNKIAAVEDLNSEYIEHTKKSTVSVTEYVKISEGCNNNCTYCIIPKLRGRNRSRAIEDIVKEIKYLVEKGTREVILIGQNTTDYGIDIYNEYSLAKLIREISKIEKLKWIRVLYLYPDNFSDELIEEFKTNDKLLKYADIPLQHHSDKILKLMNRRTSREEIVNLVEKLKREIPGIVLRTTYIVGFPGEDESDFEILKNFVKKGHFTRLGVFTYSREEGTPAYSIPNQVDEEVKEKRQNEIMEIQMEVSKRILEGFVDKELTVLVEEKVDDNTFVGRSYIDAPEIDGCTYITTDRDLDIGSFVKVKITDSMEYDLIGETL